LKKPVVRWIEGSGGMARPTTTAGATAKAGRCAFMAALHERLPIAPDRSMERIVRLID
jgi:hypothetical protein